MPAEKCQRSDRQLSETVAVEGVEEDHGPPEPVVELGGLPLADHLETLPREAEDGASPSAAAIGHRRPDREVLHSVAVQIAQCADCESEQGGARIDRLSTLRLLEPCLRNLRSRLRECEQRARPVQEKEHRPCTAQR